MGTLARKMTLTARRQAPKVHIKKFFGAAKKQVAAAKEGNVKKTGSRLYVKGIVAGYRRALTNQKNHTSLIKIQGVDETKDVSFYLGKKIMYMYRTKTEKEGSRFRVMWGKVCALTVHPVSCVPSSPRTSHHRPS